MPPRPRRAEMFSVTGAVVTTLIGAVYLGSVVFSFGWLGSVGQGARLFSIAAGAVHVSWVDAQPARFGEPGWYFRRSHSTLGAMCWGVQAENSTGLRSLTVPLWMPLLAVLAPTLFRLQVARRPVRLLTQCKTCGYDLSGAPSAVCPVCGAGRAP